MPRFSANLGFLWKKLHLPEQIRTAANRGFKAVECHLPYTFNTTEVSTALKETGLPMLALNTPFDPTGVDNHGYASIPRYRQEARSGIDKALEYAAAIDARNIHIMAGLGGDDAAAQKCYFDNLEYASLKAAETAIGVLIEPINRYDRPGYFLHRTDQAAEIIRELGADNVRLMFDCFHVQKTEGNLSYRLQNHISIIGHIQIASVPDRMEPNEGEIAYDYLFQFIDRIGYTGFVGAEYIPRHDTDEGLTWYEKYRRQGSTRGPSI